MDTKECKEFMEIKIHKTEKGEYAEFVDFCCDDMKEACKLGSVFYDNVSKKIYLSKVYYYPLGNSCSFCGKEFIILRR